MSKKLLSKGLLSRRLYLGLGLLGVAWLFVTIFSYNTSPIFKEWGDNTDSAIFNIIGKYWAQGCLPYVDLWDLKGPLIFFVNAVGFWIASSRLGVYFLQIASLTITLIGAYRIFRTHFHVKTSFVLTMVSLASLSYTYSGGNLTEEYMLPLLMFSFYGVVKWVKASETGNQPTHPLSYAFLYGVTFGACLLTRLTNALPICGAVAVVAVVLIKRRMFRNLISCITAFVLGFLFVTLPFIAYFLYHDALQSMWNATFLYAFHYASNSSKDVLESGLHYFLLSYFNSILLLFVCFLLVIFRRQESLRICTWLCAALLPFIWFCQGNGFGNYGTIVLPLFPIAMIEVHRLRSRTLLFAVVAIMMVACGSKIRWMHYLYSYTNQERVDIQAFLHRSPEVDYSSFVAYNSTPYIYLERDIRPAAPFFTLQDFFRDRIPGWDSIIVTTFTAKRPEWIMVKRDAYESNETLLIQPLLDESYRLVSSDREKGLDLYRSCRPSPDRGE
jgi:hypothetical protein